MSKAEKEAFVTGHTGTTQVEIVSVISVLPFAQVLCACGAFLYCLNGPRMTRLCHFQSMHPSQKENNRPSQHFRPLRDAMYPPASARMQIQATADPKARSLNHAVDETKITFMQGTCRISCKTQQEGRQGILSIASNTTLPSSRFWTTATFTRRL
jgi:hypothetical protein